jgi:hypothetical protein
MEFSSDVLPFSSIAMKYRFLQVGFLLFLIAFCFLCGACSMLDMSELHDANALGKGNI